jgi:plastocyanin
MAGSQHSTIAAPSPTPTPTAIPTPQPNHVDILANPSGSSPEAYYVSSGFSTTLTVRVGQKVTWVNQDSRPHSATADNGAFDSGELSHGQTFSWTPTRPGHYTYGDLSYPDMKGTIIVQP